MGDDGRSRATALLEQKAREGKVLPHFRPFASIPFNIYAGFMAKMGPIVGNTFRIFGNTFPGFGEGRKCETA